MKKIKIFLVVVVAFFGYWFISSAIELHGLMKKYPNEFKQQGDFSFYKFYNTYRTLSYGDIMVKRGYVHHDICFESTNHVEPSGSNCLNEAKLTRFVLNCNEAYATYACERDGVITEFTYTGNRDQKCFVGSYHKNSTFISYPTLRDTLKSESWYPDSIFDNPECTP